MKLMTTSIVLLLGLFLLGLTPVHAQAGDVGAVSEAAGSNAISGTVQISDANAQAIRSLLEETAEIPGGYRGYGRALFWAFFFGSLGGLVYELLRLHGNIELPHRYSAEDVPDDEEYRLAPYAIGKWAVDLGFLARMFVGGMAALAILLIISPPDRLKLIAVAVIAGSAGASIFDVMRARLTATLAVADAADLRAKSKQLDEKLQGMDTVVRQLKGQAGAPTGGGRAVTPAAAPAPTNTAALLDELDRTLGEAKGIRSTMERR